MKKPQLLKRLEVAAGSARGSPLAASAGVARTAELDQVVEHVLGGERALAQTQFL
jgi:hypothetical protein